MNVLDMMIVLSGFQAFLPSTTLEDCRLKMDSKADTYLSVEQMWLETEVLKLLQDKAKTLIESVPFMERSHCVYMLEDYFFEVSLVLNGEKPRPLNMMLEGFAIMVNKILDRGFRFEEEVKILKRGLTLAHGALLRTRYNELLSHFCHRFLSRIAEEGDLCSLYGLFVARDVRDYFPNMEEVFDAFRDDEEEIY